MKRIKKLCSGLIALAMIMSFWVVIPVSASSYIHQDEDASLDSKWIKQENYDDEYGNVYKFTNATYEGTDWFSSEFEDGTYVVSMDFKVDGEMAEESINSIIVDSETWKDRTQLNIRADGAAAITVRDESAVRFAHTWVRYSNDWNVWNNYSIVYEKNGTDVDVTQYLNGTKLRDTVRISDNFRFKRITVVENGGANLYIDNIICRKIESTDTLSIQNVKSILSKGSMYSVKTIRVKLNQPIDATTVSSVTVTKSNGSNVATGYKIIGQYIDVAVNDIEIEEGYTLTIDSNIKGLTGNGISNNTYLKNGQENVGQYIHKDENALLDSKWTNQENYDAKHGNVYKFTNATYEGTDWFSSEFEDGTYVVSMDFKVDGEMAEESINSIIVDSETWKDRTQLNLRADGAAAIMVRDESAVRFAHTFVRYSNDWNVWNNYSIVYEKNGTDVDVTQYLNGTKLRDAVRVSDNFRFKRITVVEGGGANLYIDNIVCRSVYAEQLKIERVTPVLRNEFSNGIKELAVKFNQPINPESVSDISVIKTESIENLAKNYVVTGQYLYISVRNLELGDGYTLSLGDDIYSITGNGILNSTYTQAAQAIDENAMYAHQDENASLDSKWTKQENYDAEHGNVYKFTHGNTTYEGTDWSSSEFEDGTYVVSMDFKMSSYPTDDAKTLIHIDSETWKDRTTLYLRPDGKVSYVIRDAEAIRQNYDTRYGTNYVGGEWSNYSVVYEKVGTTVGVTQYINGVKIHNTVTVYDNFRFKRITVVTDSTADLYIDNITCRKVSDEEKFTIESVNTLGDESSIEKIVVKFNQPVNPTSITSVNVENDSSQNNFATGYKTVGQYVYIDVNDLQEVDGFTVTFNNGFTSILGLGLAKSSYTVEPDLSETVAYWVCDGTSEQNIESVELVGGTSSLITLAGKQCWNVNNEIKFELSDNIKPTQFDGSEYEFEIVYYDGERDEINSDGNANFFQLMYDGLEGNDVNYDNIVYKKGTGIWKTAIINVDDITFDNGNRDCDFKLSTKGILPAAGYYSDRASSYPIQIHSVRVTRTVAKNPIFVTTSTNSSSNSFAWFDNNKQIINTYKNVSGENKNVKLVTKILDSSNSKCFESIENININADDTAVLTINFGSLKKCGVFKVVTEVIDSEVTVSSFDTVKIAILKADPNGVNDKNVFLSFHSERYDAAQQEAAADILSLMNVAGARVSISWDRMLVKNSDGEYELNWDSNSNKNFVSLLKERGMTAFGSMGGTPSKTKDSDSPGYMCMPISDTEIAAFDGYAEYVGANVVKDGFSYIEFFNEPNLKSFITNLEDASGTEYAKVAISAKNALLNAAASAGVSDLKVAGPGVTGIDQRASYTASHLEDGARGGFDYLQQAVDAGFADNFDNVSFHNYTWDDAERIKLTSINNIRKLWTNKGLASPNLWITEAGFYKGATYSSTDRTQGAQNIRQILTHKLCGAFGDVYSIYGLERKGYNPDFREVNFGLINPMYSDLRMDGCIGLPTESAVMIAAMTYVMPNSEFVSSENIELEDDEIVVSKFTSSKWNDKQIITAYNLDNRAVTTTIDLGVNSVKCFDEYGNESILTSTNGKYNVEIDEAPIYFVADFDGMASTTPNLSIIVNDVPCGREEVSGQNIDFSNITFEIENANELPAHFIIITSFYKDSKLINIDLLPCSNPDIVDNKVTISSSISNVENYDEVKFTIWNDFAHMEPLIKIWECK